MKVTLFAETIINRDWFEKLDSITNYCNAGKSDLELLAFKAGKICVGEHNNPFPEDETIGKFLDLNINKLKHESLLEHWQCTFIIEGVSRALTHQLVRHRHGSYAQTSQRYTEVLTEDNPLDDVVIPERIKDDPKALLIFFETLKLCKLSYEALRNQGIKKEDARAISPQCHKTNIMVTFNARSLKDFFRLRLWGKGVQSEIKELAEEMYYLVRHNGNFFNKENC